VDEVRVERTADAAFVVEFESEDELREEHRRNLSQGGLQLPTAESVVPFTQLSVALRGPGGAETAVRATVVAALPDGLALAVEADGDEVLRQLLPGPAPPAPEPEAPPARDGGNTWDRIRALTQMEKLLLAVKADRSERALLLQDNDPRVLLSLLRNPRLTVDEVVRLAKSSFLTFQIAEVIMKTPQWMAGLDVRLGLIHNPKTPPAFALRILPTLPDAEVRTIARSGTNMALKQAALRRLQGNK
jgi:PilZ domain